MSLITLQGAGARPRRIRHRRHALRAGAPFRLQRPQPLSAGRTLRRLGDGARCRRPPVPPQPVQAILRRPDGKAQWTATWQPEAGLRRLLPARRRTAGRCRHRLLELELRADPAAKVASTSMRFAVEEFLPERMKLELSTASERLDAQSGWQIDAAGATSTARRPPATACSASPPASATATRWRRSCPASSSATPTKTRVKSRSELPRTRLDDQGKTSIDGRPGAGRQRRSPFTVRATLSLLESGGRPVVRSIERVYLAGAGAGRPAADVRRRLRARRRAGRLRGGARRHAAAALKAGTALPVRLFREEPQLLLALRRPARLAFGLQRGTSWWRRRRSRCPPAGAAS
jgi:hypothetical protein